MIKEDIMQNNNFETNGDQSFPSASFEISETLMNNINDVKNILNNFKEKIETPLSFDDAGLLLQEITEISELIDSTQPLKIYLGMKYGYQYIKRIDHLKTFVQQNDSYNSDALKAYFDKEIKDPLDFFN